MTAYNFLNEIEVLDTKINDKILEKEALFTMLTRKTSTLQADRVQTSISGDKLTVGVADIIDIEKEINEAIDDFVIQKDIRINSIHNLKSVNHIKVLFKKYIEFKDFQDIAKEMNYSYQWIIELHNAALTEFERTNGSLLK